MSQFGLRFARRDLLLFQGFFGKLLRSDIRHRTNELNSAGLLFGRRMAHNPQIFDGSIRHQQAMLKVEILSFIGNAINEFPDHASICWMSSMEYEFQSRLSLRVVFKDAE